MWSVKGGMTQIWLFYILKKKKLILIKFGLMVGTIKSFQKYPIFSLKIKVT